MNPAAVVAGLKRRRKARLTFAVSAHKDMLLRCRSGNGKKKEPALLDLVWTDRRSTEPPRKKSGPNPSPPPQAANETAGKA